VRYTAPAGGTVAAVNRGARRVLQSVVIDVDGDDAVDFGAVDAEAARNLDRAAVRKQTARFGAVDVALRTRPFSKVPAPDHEPAAIFVTAMDTHPLAADPALIIGEQPRLSNSAWTCSPLRRRHHLPVHGGRRFPTGSAASHPREEFAGPHPAGLPGTHIHFLLGASAERSVWTVNYQDVIAIGRLFLDGRLYYAARGCPGRAAGRAPRLAAHAARCRSQALCAGEMRPGDNRIISGSVLGRTQASSGATAYLGRYHQQVSVLAEGREREFMHGCRRRHQRHSVMGVYLSSFFGLKPQPMTTSTNGSERAMVPVGNYERVMPLDILPTQLLRSLIVGDTETAQALGCLELDEEDLALCTYVCPGKYEYGPILRDNLTRIEKEG
jgi:Na+-transporting NADH:ubiquinone oxidoreductase subunit A